MLLFLRCFLDNRHTLFKKKEKENLTTRIFSKCWKKSKWSQQMDLKIKNKKIAAYFIASLCCTCICRPLVLSWTQTGALLNLISLTWALNKKAYGSAGCPPMEARTRVNSPSLLKVCDLWHFKVLYRLVNFKIIKKRPCFFSVPPMPITAPKLLEKRSKQLLVMPVYTSVGDGPIISIRVLYKPVENKNEDLWSSIIGIREKHIHVVTQSVFIRKKSNHR